MEIKFIIKLAIVIVDKIEIIKGNKTGIHKIVFLRGFPWNRTKKLYHTNLNLNLKSKLPIREMIFPQRAAEGTGKDRIRNLTSGNSFPMYQSQRPLERWKENTAVFYHVKRMVKGNWNTSWKHVWNEEDEEEERWNIWVTKREEGKTLY